MMKWNLLFVAAILIQLNVRAQPGGTAYYRCVNKAELAICKESLITAIQHYKEAFRINPYKPYSRDLLNAYYCAMDLREYDLAETYLRRLLSRGINSHAIKDKIRGRYHGADIDSIDHWLANYRNDTGTSNSTFLELKSMHTRDQETREYFSRKFNGKYMVDSVYDMDEANGRRLSVLFKNSGVPNEDIAPNLNFDPLAPPVYGIVVMHYAGVYQDCRNSHLLDTLLFNAIFTYDFHPERFAQLMNSYEFNSKQEGFLHKDVNLHVPLTINCIFVEDTRKVYPQYFPLVKEKQINRERELIGLEPLDELRQKVAFSNKHEPLNDSYSKFVLGTGVGMYSAAETEEQAKPYIAEFSRHRPQ